MGETRRAVDHEDGGRRGVENVGSTRWLAQRANPRRSAPRWTRPTRKRTLSGEGKRRSFVCWRSLIGHFHRRERGRERVRERERKGIARAKQELLTLCARLEAKNEKLLGRLL